MHAPQDLLLVQVTMAVSGNQNPLFPLDSCVSASLGPDQHCRIQAFSACTGARQVIYLKDLGQVEQSGYAEIEFTLQSVQTHTALPVPGIIASADPNIILISLQPRILLIENFLSAADCQVKASRAVDTLCMTASAISCTILSGKSDSSAETFV